MTLRKNLLRVVTIIFGSLIYSIGVNMFIIPHKFLSGGVAGIAIICEYLTSIPSGYFVIVINIPIFIIGFKIIDKEFGIFSFIGMVSMSLGLIFTKQYINYTICPIHFYPHCAVVCSQESEPD